MNRTYFNADKRKSNADSRRFKVIRDYPRSIGMFFLAFLIFLSAYAGAEEYIQARGAVQISSTISDGSYQIKDIVGLVKNDGLDVVIITDRDLMRWQYGLWPLRRVLKMTVEQSSIFKYGIKRYLKDIAAAQAAYPNVVVIPGMESAPFYYWKGGAFDPIFAIKNWHRHIMIVGLENAVDMRHIPVTGNVAGLALPFKISDLGYFLFPIIAFATGIYLLFTKRFQYKRFHSAVINVGSKRIRIMGVASILLGIALMAYGFPYRELKYDQFRGDLGIMPYQNFIDYINRKGGMTFWVQPESENIDKVGSVKIETKEHSEVLLQSHDYTGFSVFYDGYERAGRPGGIWDDVLNEYCDRKRHRPVWAIGGLGLDRSTDMAKDIRELQTVFLVRSLGKKEVLDAMREGRMYVVRGNDKPRFILDYFAVHNSKGAGATMGGEVAWDGPATLEIRGHFDGQKDTPVKVRIIRNGVVTKIFETISPISLSYMEESGTPRDFDYYRIEIESQNLFVVTNPIFVRKR